MEPPTGMPDVLTYRNHRDYLRDFYEAKKRLNPRFSHRVLLPKLGLKSSGHFSKILQGRAVLSPETLSRFVAFAQLGRKQREYLEILVRFDSARDPELKSQLFQKLRHFKGAKAHSLGPAHAELFSAWYIIPLRELLSVHSGKDAAALGKALSPPVSPGRVRKALQLLEECGLIKNRDGFYIPTQAALTVDRQTALFSLRPFHLAMLDLAGRAYDRVEPAERHFSTLTLSLSREAQDRIVERLAEARAAILQIATEDERPADRVVQLNLSLFPLSELPSKERP